MRHLSAIVVLSGMLAFSTPFETSSAATIQSIVDSVSTSSYQGYQLAVESMGPGGGSTIRNRDWNWAGGVAEPGNLAAQAYLTDAFTSMGLTTTTQSAYQNIVAELPGTATPQNIYIVSAHFDHIAGDSPGGDDNASGTAAVLEAARVLSRHQFESTIRFIGFNAEEDGLQGSSQYVAAAFGAGDNILGVINLDMILRPGWENDAGAVIDLDLGCSTDAESRAWAAAYQQAAEDYVPSLTVDETVFDLGARSDHFPFELLGYAAFTAIENTDTELAAANPYYHTSDDASDRAAGALYDYAFAADVVRASVGLLAQEAVHVPEPATVVMLVTAALIAIPLVRQRKRIE